ncbi:hypothetical protein E4U53_007541 [Claviceps sorghi]|nr:hypothetical protein E4U53_007541 [Claviceps sorghi]
MATEQQPAPPPAAATQTSDDTGRPAQRVLPPPYEQANAALPGQSHAQDAQPPATVIPLHQLTDQPQWIDCPFCHRRAMTVVRREGTSMQIIIGAVLCLVCICLTCLPCLAGWFEDTQHWCSSCNSMVAVRRHDGPLEVLGPQVPVYSQYSGNHGPMVHQQQQPQQQHELHEVQARPQHQDATPQPPSKS